MRIRVMSPMYGTVSQLLAEEGAPLKTGDIFMQIEAMKMMFDIQAPTDGVLQLATKLGQTVDAETVLAYIVKSPQ